MKRFFLSLIFLLTIASLSGSSEQSPDEQIARLEKTVNEQSRTIERAQKMVIRLRKQLEEQQRENRRLLILCKKAKIDIRTKSEIEQAERVAGPLKLPIEIGQTVFFDKAQYFRVLQVVDDQNLIAEVCIDNEPIYNTSYRESMYLTSTPVSGCKLITRTVWISGLNTSEYVDNTIISPDRAYLFKIARTRSFDSLFTGRETLFVLEPFISQD